MFCFVRLVSVYIASSRRKRRNKVPQPGNKAAFCVAFPNFMVLIFYITKIVLCIVKPMSTVYYEDECGTVLLGF